MMWHRRLQSFSVPLVFLSVALASAFVLAVQSTSTFKATSAHLSLAATLYLASHVFRVIRLVSLSIDEPFAAYLVGPAHLLTAPLGFFLPFKIGELFRIVAMAASFRRIKKGLLIWALERVGDFAVLIIGSLLLVWFGNATVINFAPLAFSIVAISITVLLGVWAVFDLSSFLTEVLVIRSNSSFGFFLLKQASELRALASALRTSLSGRILTLIVSSIFIWGLEFAAMLAAANAFSRSVRLEVEVFLASLFRNSVVAAAYRSVAGHSQIVLLLGGVLSAVVFFKRTTSKRAIS
jgi:hypothetical protein